MTDNEIKKALECCSNNVLYEQCVDCPHKEYLEKGHTCIIKATKKALNLINRLQAENERLEREAFTYKIRWAKSEVRETKAKAEAYKEFAELCKKEVPPYSRAIIDNLLKEKVGEDNA